MKHLFLVFSFILWSSTICSQSQEKATKPFKILLNVDQYGRREIRTVISTTVTIEGKDENSRDRLPRFHEQIATFPDMEVQFFEYLLENHSSLMQRLKNKGYTLTARHELPSYLPLVFRKFRGITPENPPAIPEDEVQELLIIDDFVYQQGKYMEDRSMYRLYLTKEGEALHKKMIGFFK